MKILLADDHTLFRDALTQYLERAYAGVNIVVAADYYQASDILVHDKGFELVLLDFRMPGMEGLDGLAHLVARYPDLKIALMSGVAEADIVARAMDIGAAGYFPKTLSGKGLLGAIAAVMDGKKYVPLEKNGRVMPSYFIQARDDKSARNNDGDIGRAALNDFDPVGAHSSNITPSHDAIHFTPREKQVLQYLMRGMPNKEIAYDLGLQLVTVKLHVRGICRKLNVKNRTQAAILARELGFWENGQGGIVSD